MKTLQDAANKIARHLFEQKKRSFNGDNCMYRITSDSGRLLNRCAVGCLIEKKHYTCELEKKGVYREVVQQAIGKSGYGISSKALDFYERAQSIHDRDWDNRNVAFKELCAEYNLEYNPS